jgi:hypothetical protein
MKEKSLYVLAFGFILVFFSFIAVSRGTEESSEVKLRADEGELVWILLNHVKPDKRQQFEEFMDILDKTCMDLVKGGKVSPEEAKAYKQMRFLHPTQANEDGSYTYVFLSDPWIEGVESRIGAWLRKKYSEEEAQKYGRMFSDSLMHPQVSYMSKQAKHKQ